MNEALEQKIRQRCEAGDVEGAVTVALEGYGREVMGFLYARTRDETAAGDVFSLLAEDLWKGLPGFSWRSSFRTWMYVLARNAAYRHRKKRGPAPVGLSKVSKVAQRIRTETQHYLRTEAKEQLAELRGALDPEDQQIIVLRTKRGLRWNEVAAVMIGDDDLESAEVQRAAARYRQRYKKLKERLRARAREAGLLEDS